MLSLLDNGDILSHCFTWKAGGVIRPDGNVLPEFKEAIQRGVALDASPAATHWSFEVAKRGLEHGILPTTMSTDLTINNINGPVFSLLVTMSKFLALGLDLKKVIEMSTINPARALGIDGRRGSLATGMDADVSILELLSGTWNLEDAKQQTIKATTLIAPSMTIKSGQLIPAQLVAKPQPIN